MATFTYSTPNSPRTRTVVLVVHKTSRVVNYIPKSDGQYEGSGEGSSVMSYALANRSDFRMNILSPGTILHIKSKVMLCDSSFVDSYFLLQIR